MILFQKMIMLKIKKPGKISISMRLRLFLFLLVFIFTMVTGVILILLVTGTFTTGLSGSKRLIREELDHSSKDLSVQFGQLSIEAVEFSGILSKNIEDYLSDLHLTTQDLQQHPELLEKLEADLFDATYFALQKSKCSGAFFILDATVNPSLKHSDQSKSGLYIKNMEPNIINSSSPTITILRGFPSIVRKNSINLHTQWNMEFNIDQALYYTIPIETASQNADIPLSHLYYWNDPFIFPGTSEQIMLCSVPLIDSNHHIFGVCGFEISEMLFKLSYMPNNDYYSRMFFMLSPISNASVNTGCSMFAGGYSVKDISEKDIFLNIADTKNSFITYSSNDSNIYIGLHTLVQLYPEGSPFYGQQWVSAMLVPKEDIVTSVTQLNWTLCALLSMLVFIGILLSIVFSNKYIKPISNSINTIKTNQMENVEKTNIQEIDELLQYLAIYKEEMNKKVEHKNHQISILEQFMERTKSLTPAERSVFLLYIQGLTAQEIAGSLFLSINTIKTHSKHIFAKLSISSREELLLYINMLHELGYELIESNPPDVENR